MARYILAVIKDGRILEMTASWNPEELMTRKEYPRFKQPGANVQIWDTKREKIWWME